MRIVRNLKDFFFDTRDAIAMRSAIKYAFIFNFQTRKTSSELYYSPGLNILIYSLILSTFLLFSLSFFS